VGGRRIGDGGETVPDDGVREIRELLTRLAETPARLRAALAGRGTADVTARPAAGGPDDEASWSALEVLAHLRASDDILAPRLIAMLVREEPPLPAFDERRWTRVMGYADADPHQLLTAFVAKRAELLAVLRRLKPRDWQRTATHEARGRITLLVTARHLADHETEHCLQLEAALAAARPGVST
jgi:hypothetical protein